MTPLFLSLAFAMADPGDDERRFAEDIKRRTADLEATLQKYTGK